MYVQIPLARGGGVRGGEIQVSWKKEREGKRRDPRTPARMSMRLDTAGLGPVGVQMQLLGRALSLVFQVYDAEIQGFLGRELPGLVKRLTGYDFTVDRCACEVEAPAAVPAATRPVAPTSSLDLRA